MRNIFEYPPMEEDINGALQFAKQQVAEKAPFSTFGGSLEAIQRYLKNNPAAMAEILVEMKKLYGVP